MILFRNLASKALLITVSVGSMVVVLSASSVSAQEESGPADLARGEQLFQLCTQCHASDGGGNSKYLAPAIAGFPEWYVVAQLEKFHSGARGLNPKDTGGLRMYPMSLWLRSDEDRQDVSAYVASLPRLAPKNEFHEPGNAELGAGYYAVCSACHMADGSGNQGMGAPPLTGMSDWYLYSSILKYKEGIRGSGKGDSLGPVMIGMAATLPDPAAIRDVIAYIQTLGQD